MKFRPFCTLLRARGVNRFAVALLLSCFAMCMGLGSTMVRAAEVTGLYEAGVMVTSRDDERQRQQAFNAAMREVLVKLTGRRDTDDNPVIARALASPQSYVETYSYNSIIPEDPFAQPGQAVQIQLQVTFFQAGLQQLLDEAGIPVWPGNRPDTLLWITVQDELGERYRAAPQPDQGGDLIAAVENAAMKRGVPVLLPLQDFIDLRALTIEQMWNFDLNALRIASGRYQAESILALRVFRALSGDVIAKAVYIFRDQVKEFDVLEGELEPFIEGSIDLVAGNLASYYAIMLSGASDGNQEQVILTVDGIDSASDYAGLLRYLNGLAAVTGVQVLSAQEDTLQLQLDTGGQSRQLIESIALDRRLRALGEVTRDGPQALAHYEWFAQP